MKNVLYPFAFKMLSMNRFAVALLAIALVPMAASAYTTSIHAPAVLVGLYQGTLTNITLNITPGNGQVTINNGSSLVGASTVQSAETAVGYAASYLNVSENKYNYAFTIGNNNSNVSGPSAGLAMTLLTISGIEHVPLYRNFTVTGTINSNGSVGLIGGIFDKVQAAKSINATFILAPYTQNQTSEYMLYYLSQQAYGIPVVMVSNVTQALPYAFGKSAPEPIKYNITTEYNPSGIENASQACPACNYSDFASITNFTFNFTNSQIESINSTKFGALKSQLYGQLSQYREIAGKGYLYTGADLAFIEDPTAFIFSRYNDSEPAVYSMIQNITYGCESLNYTPQMTSSNYQLVIGGEARVSWALATLSEAAALLNSSQTSDGVILSLYDAAPSISWCAAASKMYGIAAETGGEPIAASSYVKAEAAAGISAAKAKYGNNLYVDSAESSFNRGQYAAALYSLAYADVFYNSSPTNYSNAKYVVSNAISRASGLWPTQFALEGYFYLAEANASTSNLTKSSYLSNAYTTAMLSISLSNLDSMLQSNFVPQPQSSTQQSSLLQLQEGLSSLNAELNYVFYALVVAIIILLLILYELHELVKAAAWRNRPVKRGKA